MYINYSIKLDTSCCSKHLDIGAGMVSLDHNPLHTAPPSLTLRTTHHYSTHISYKYTNITSAHVLVHFLLLAIVYTFLGVREKFST